MKAKRLLFGFITLVVSAFSLVAQDVISVNAEHLNSGQKKSLQYAKKILKTQGNKIMLPLEINALIGDTITLEPYVATIGQLIIKHLRDAVSVVYTACKVGNA